MSDYRIIVFKYLGLTTLSVEKLKKKVCNKLSLVKFNVNLMVDI